MPESLPRMISGYNRRRKWGLFEREIGFDPEQTILDVGFTEDEYSSTENFMEKHYPYPEKITALGIEHAVKFRQSYPKVKVVNYDGKKFPFEDNEFDLAWSNAVVEHVGPEEDQIRFVSELNRVGKRVFLTTPNKYFPFEVHTRTPLLHFLLPQRWFDRWLDLIGKPWAKGDFMFLLSQTDLKRILHAAGVEEYRIYKNRLGGFVVDFVIIF